jgi:hypothetical protein
MVERGAIQWAGQAEYAGAEDLAEVLARLAGEAGAPVRRARIVLERDIVQLRTITPGPPLKAEALRRYIALEMPRLFRKSGVPLVTDGLSVRSSHGTSGLWVGAVPEPLVEAALKGCAQAGLLVEAVGPAADVLPMALAALPTSGDVAFPNGGTSEVLSVGPAGVWRSRHVPGSEPREIAWNPALARLGSDAAPLAPAYAATLALTRLDLSPPSVGATRRRAALQRRFRLAVVGVALWLLAGGIYALRLAATASAVRRELAANAAAVDTALALRRDFDSATATLATIATAQRVRSREVALVAALTAALGDSAYLVALQAAADGTVRLVGYAPAATRVLADLERVPDLRGAKLEGPVTREAPPGRPEMDRFSIVAQRIGAP